MAEPTLDTTTDAQRSPPRTVRIGGRKYAFGLVWHTAQSARSAAREAKALAREAGFAADLYVARGKDEPEPQFGLGRRADGLEAGAHAAAAAAAAAQRGTWTGVFKVGPGWWRVAVRDDIVLPDGDEWYDDESAARARLGEDGRSGDWARVFAPGKDWQDGAEELAVEEIFETARGPKLADVNPFNARAKIALAMLGALIVLGGAAAMLFFWKTETPAPLALPPPMPARAAPTPPWWLQPAAATLLDGCLAEFERDGGAVPGFRLKGVACQPPGGQGIARVVFTYVRDGGADPWLRAWLSGRVRRGGVLAFGPKTDSLTVPLPEDDARRRGEEGIKSFPEIAASLAGIAQSAGADLRLAEPKAPQPPSGPAAASYVRPAWAPASFEIRTATPRAWLPVLSHIPGLVLAGAAYQPDDSIWLLKGDVYVRN